MASNIDNRTCKRIITNRYKVKQEIFGGMGVIYLCVDSEQNNLPVVLKTCKAQYFSNKNVRAQFLRETAIWVEIGRHPNIVQAYRAEYVSNSHEIYLILEMVPSLSGGKNPTLRSWLNPGIGIPLDKTLKLILEVTRGMKYATMKVPGLIHCDIKPENIFISPDGRACVSDFGLATTPCEIFGKLSESVLRYINTRSKPVGTPHYMSPEQWRNRKVTISSDIYSLGCICLEMLTGDYTVSGHDIPTIVEGHVRGQALNRLIGVNLPEVLDAFFAKCIDPDPLYRFQTWEEVELAIINLYDVLLHQKVEPENILFDVSHKTQVLKGKTILSIGEAYLDIQEFQAAIKCFEKARAIGKLQKSLSLVAQSEAKIGLAYFILGYHERGRAHYQKAMAYSRQCGEHEISKLTFNNIGNAYSQLGDLARAQNNITKVIEYSP
jgi:serine/threonine protein kinase